MTARARLLSAAVLGALALPAVAWGQPPSGIVHVEDAEKLPLLELGSELYAGNCSMCHGIEGRGIRVPTEGPGGIRGRGPSLRGVGAQAADFYLRTGYMPLTDPDDQPERRRVLFSEREIRALVAYVDSLGGGPPIPDPEPRRGSLPEGLELFTEHCAGCHQIVAQGGVVTGARVPPLEESTPRQVAEAVRVGPYLMPKFSKKDISDAELDSLIAYVQRAKDPVDRGGWGIGNLGPFPEGMVTWLIAALSFITVCMIIGQRLRS